MDVQDVQNERHVTFDLSARTIKLEMTPEEPEPDLGEQKVQIYANYLTAAPDKFQIGVKSSNWWYECKKFMCCAIEQRGFTSNDIPDIVKEVLPEVEFAVKPVARSCCACVGPDFSPLMQQHLVAHFKTLYPHTFSGTVFTTIAKQAVADVDLTKYIAVRSDHTVNPNLHPAVWQYMTRHHFYDVMVARGDEILANTISFVINRLVLRGLFITASSNPHHTQLPLNSTLGPSTLSSRSDPSSAGGPSVAR
jgi:hypothetical protein